MATGNHYDYGENKQARRKQFIQQCATRRSYSACARVCVQQFQQPVYYIRVRTFDYEERKSRTYQQGPDQA
jgi:hypothetical protein